MKPGGMNTLLWALTAVCCLLGMSVVAAAMRPAHQPPDAGSRGSVDHPDDGLPPSAEGALHEGSGAYSAITQEIQERPGAYRAVPGPYDVIHHDFTLHDGGRGKDLKVRVYAPIPKRNVPLATTLHPLVVFSHGAGGSRQVGPELLQFWASHGYIVASPTHDDSIELQRQLGKRANMNRIIADLGLKPETRVNRVKDVSFLVDSTAELEREAPEIAGQVDVERVAVAGHSAGAMTAMLIGGVQGEGMQNMRDPRVDCVIVLSGQGVNKGVVFKSNAWDSFKLPAFVATGSLDTSTRSGQTAKSRREPYERAPAGDKYLLFIEGATHMSFTGKLAGIPQDKRLNKLLDEYLEPGEDLSNKAFEYDQNATFASVQQSTLAFLDAYLRDDATAMEWLKAGAIRQFMPGIEWQTK